jgi:predicted MFS family arabinose efflux permease
MSKEKRLVVVIALITAICLLGDAMLYIVLPIFWRDFGLTSIWQVGVLLSINRFIRLPINPFIGYLYQRIPKKYGLYIACSLAVITTLSYGFAKEFWILLIMRSLWGVAWSIMRLGGFLSVIDASNDQNRGELIGTYNGLWGLGGLLGMLAGGFFVDLFSLEIVCTVFALLALISLPMIHFMIPLSENNVDDAKHNLQKNNQLFKQRDVIRIMTMGLLISLIIYGVFASFLSKLIVIHHGDTLNFYSITIGAATVAGIIQAIRWSWDPFLAPKVGRLLDKKFNKHIVLTIMSLLYGIYFLLLSIKAASILWFGALLFLQLLSTIIVTSMDTVVTHLANKVDKVKVMTLYTVIIDVGAALGPIIVFSTIDWLGATSLHIFVSILCILFLSLNLNHLKSEKTTLSA